MNGVASRSGSPVLSIVAGAAAAVLGAVIWGVVVAATHWQVGLLAVGIGLAVGFAMSRYATASRVLIPVAAVLALAGCVLGDLIGDIIERARFEELPLADAFRITAGDPGLAWNIFSGYFSVMNVVFWAIAAWSALRFVRAAVARATLADVQAQQVPAPQFPWTGQPTAAQAAPAQDDAVGPN